MKKTTLNRVIRGGFMALGFISMSVASAQFAGNWKLAPKAGAFAVGPAKGDYSWWGVPAEEVTGVRACQFDDLFSFNADGSFKNNLGTQTYLEGWQGGNSCGTPVAPHDGSSNGKWIYDQTAKTLTIIGKGSFMGLPKPYNGGELKAPADAKDTIVYEVDEISATSLTLSISIGSGYWKFEFVKEMPEINPVGSWNFAPKAGCFKVGPAKGDYSWWGLPASDLTVRACQMDDRFVFNQDGTFENIMDGSTWLEGWQGKDGCGTPVAPHDGTSKGKWVADKNAGTITIIGKGSFLGLPKVYNGGELKAPADAKDTIVYPATINGDTMIVEISFGTGYWYYEFVRSAAPIGSVSKFYNTGLTVYPNPATGLISLNLDRASAIQNSVIFNTVGMKVMESGNSNEINVSALPVGTYFVNVTTANGVFTSRFIKQ